MRPDKLRFDFTHPQQLTDEERERVQHLVNEKVFENLPVRTFVTPIDEARRLGAMMLFGEKYGDEVRVVEIDDYSRELCGGTHVGATGDIGFFKIVFSAVPHVMGMYLGSPGARNFRFGSKADVQISPDDRRPHSGVSTTAAGIAQTTVRFLRLIIACAYSRSGATAGLF